MISEESYIASAIQSYAVMLNRPAWLDESRLAMQIGVWRRLIQRQPGRGTVTDEHFEIAIAGLVEQNRALDVLPSHIVAEACRIAADDNDHVGRLYAAWESDSDMLLDEIGRLMSSASYGLPEFERDVAAIKVKVSSSVLSEDTVEAMLREIQNEHRNATAWYRRRETELAAAQPHVVVGDPSDVETVVADWLGGQ